MEIRLMECQAYPIYKIDYRNIVTQNTFKIGKDLSIKNNNLHNCDTCSRMKLSQKYTI